MDAPENTSRHPQTGPKIFGLVPPMDTACCGCTLQLSLKTFAGFSLVLGIIKLLSCLSQFVEESITRVDWNGWFTILTSIILGCLLLYGAFASWTAATKLRLKDARRSLYCFLTWSTLWLILLIYRIILVLTPAFKEQIKWAFREASARAGASAASADAAADKFLTFALIARITETLLLLVFLAYCCYLQLSFAFHIQSKDYSLLIAGRPPRLDGADSELHSSLIQAPTGEISQETV